MDMTGLRATAAIGLGFCGAVLVARIAIAQIPLPAPKPPDGATLFKQQCATCHTNSLTDPVRQGPSLFSIPLLGGLREGRFRLGRGQNRRLDHQPAGDDSGHRHGLPAGEAGGPRRHHRLPQGAALNG
jgi:hypothetical protein